MTATQNASLPFITASPPVEQRSPEPSAAQVPPYSSFQAIAQRRRHELWALGGLLLTVGALLASGAWMALEVAKGLAMAESDNISVATGR